MAPAGEHSASDLAVDWGKKCEISFFEEKLSIPATQLDAIRGFNLVSFGGIQLKLVQSSEQFARFTRWWLLRDEGWGAKERNERKE